MLKAIVTLHDGSKVVAEQTLIPTFDSVKFKEWFTKGISTQEYQTPKTITFNQNGESVTLNVSLREDEAEMSNKPGETDTTMALWDMDTATWKVIDLTTVTEALYTHGALTFSIEERK